MDDVSIVFMTGENPAELLELADGARLRLANRGDSGELALDPATAIALTGAAIFAARFVISVLERWRGGLRIDLGTRPPTVERIRDIPYGTILTLTADNDVRIQTVDEPKEVVERILASILGLPRDVGAQEVVDAAGSLVR